MSEYMCIIGPTATAEPEVVWSPPTAVVCLEGTIVERQIEDYRLVRGPVSGVKCGEQVDQSARSGSRGPDKRVRPCLR